MGRYTGPVEKLSRREGVELFLKGERALNGKSALERRGAAPPGQHGTRRAPRPSIYATQLRAKQRAKRYYGVRERQFRRYVREAVRRREGVTGEELVRLLERGSTTSSTGSASRPPGRRRGSSSGTDTCSSTAGASIARPTRCARARRSALDASSPVRQLAIANTELTPSVVPWLQADFESLAGKVLRVPDRSEVPAPVDEHLIIELYSRL